jgi:hypothetical protein
VHYDLGEDEIAEAIFLKDNMTSAGYDRFLR